MPTRRGQDTQLQRDITTGIPQAERLNGHGRGSPRTSKLTARPETATETVDDRPMKTAMLRGFRRKCPQCGKGKILYGYLKVVDHCPVCGEDLHHHRADDGPAYLTILIVGHIMAPLLLIVFTKFRPEPMVLAAFFMVGAAALSIYLLPRLKGLMIAIQWSRRMGGFGKSGCLHPPS